jgi:hypothetical protein
MKTVKIYLGTEPAPAGTYTLEDGTQLVVTEVGIIGEIVTPAGETVEYTALEAEIVENFSGEFYTDQTGKERMKWGWGLDAISSGECKRKIETNN